MAEKHYADAIAAYREALVQLPNDPDADKGLADARAADKPMAPPAMGETKLDPGQRENSLGMKFVPLPKGTFYMGWDGDEGSAKKTEIKEDFEIAIHTVTQGQWQDVMGKNPSYFSRAAAARTRSRTSRMRT